MSKRKDPPEQLYADNRRASGKRYRKKRDPNSWSSSILTIRSNILLLGMSYPSVERAIEEFNLSSKVHILHPEPSVEQAIELVRRRILGTIDGRDYARIKALEASNEMLAYTVSKENGGPYEKKRHLDADFNSRTFIKEIMMQWGVGFGMEPIKFKQIILDYFWIPPGTWQQMHWKPSFFRENLPQLVHKSLLQYGCLNKDIKHVHTTKHIEGGDYITSDSATIYLPFCENCFVEVVACSNVLSKSFTISFMTKGELDEHTLWKATNTISAQSMQDWLQKKIDQEEEYCQLTRQKLVCGSAIGSNHVDKNDVLDVFGRIDNVEDVRMIKLTALRCFHPEFKQIQTNWPCHLGVDKGGYVGLLKSARKVKSAPAALKPRKQLQKSAAAKADPKLSNAENKRFLTQLATLICNEAIIESDGVINIKSLNDLNDRLPSDFGSYAEFQEELARHGWRQKTSRKDAAANEQQFYYHNKSQSTLLQSLIATRKEKSCGRRKSATRKCHAKKNTTTGSSKKVKVVLSNKNKMYKEKMYELFRSYAERRVYKEEILKDAKLILQQLKHAANGFEHSHSYNESCSESIETTYLKYSPDNNLYAVSEGVALKKILNDIINRWSIRHSWMQHSSPATVNTKSSRREKASPPFSGSTSKRNLRTCPLSTGQSRDGTDITERNEPAIEDTTSLIEVADSGTEVVEDYFFIRMREMKNEEDTRSGVSVSQTDSKPSAHATVSDLASKTDSDMSSCTADSDTYIVAATEMNNAGELTPPSTSVSQSDPQSMQMVTRSKTNRSVIAANQAISSVVLQQPNQSIGRQAIV